MHKNLREIQTKINDQLDEHSNKLKLNKKIKDTIENEITIEFTRCLIRQKAILLKQTACVQNVLESNLNNLITKEKDLLARIKLTNSYDEIQNDLNELEALNTKLQLDFNYEFKKNTITKDNHNIGNLLVLYNLVLLFILLINNY